LSPQHQKDQSFENSNSPEKGAENKDEQKETSQTNIESTKQELRSQNSLDETIKLNEIKTTERPQARVQEKILEESKNIESERTSRPSSSSEIKDNKGDGNTQGENRKLKTIIQYNFFSRKLNGDYIINSTDLFNLDEMRSIH
jgi:hypothetical protein